MQVRAQRLVLAREAIVGLHRDTSQWVSEAAEFVKACELYLLGKVPATGVDYQRLHAAIGDIAGAIMTVRLACADAEIRQRTYNAMRLIAEFGDCFGRAKGTRKLTQADLDTATSAIAAFIIEAGAVTELGTQNYALKLTWWQGRRAKQLYEDAGGKLEAEQAAQE